MSNFKNNFDHAKNKFTGETKKTVGKITGNEQLELKGKLQSSKADLKQNLNVADRIDDIKENIAESINNRIDKKKKKKSKR